MPSKKQAAKPPAKPPAAKPPAKPPATKPPAATTAKPPAKQTTTPAKQTTTPPAAAAKEAPPAAAAKEAAPAAAHVTDLEALKKKVKEAKLNNVVKKSEDVKFKLQTELYMLSNEITELQTTVKKKYIC